MQAQAPWRRAILFFLTKLYPPFSSLSRRRLHLQFYSVSPLSLNTCFNKHFLFCTATFLQKSLHIIKSIFPLLPTQQPIGNMFSIISISALLASISVFVSAQSIDPNVCFPCCHSSSSYMLMGALSPCLSVPEINGVLLRLPNAP